MEQDREEYRGERPAVVDPLLTFLHISLLMIFSRASQAHEPVLMRPAAQVINSGASTLEKMGETLFGECPRGLQRTL